MYSFPGHPEVSFGAQDFTRSNLHLRMRRIEGTKKESREANGGHSVLHRRLTTYFVEM